jgi:hypothetical protein
MFRNISNVTMCVIELQLHSYSSLKNIILEITKYEGLVSLMEMVPRSVEEWNGEA